MYLYYYIHRDAVHRPFFSFTRTFFTSKMSYGFTLKYNLTDDRMKSASFSARIFAELTNAYAELCADLLYCISCR